MMISCICVTCARVHHLENAIHSFVGQKYAGQKELVVLNTAPVQKLTISWPHGNASFPNINIINLDKRPTSLGEARNMAIEKANGDIIVTFDDDDGYLPHHLQTIADGFTDGSDWIWLDRQFWGWGNAIKDIVKGQCPCFAFTKKAWKEAGGYANELSVGEDRLFIANVTTRFAGHYVEVKGTPSFVYRWNNNVYHISGQGDDNPGKPSSWDRYWADVIVRVNSGQEPQGPIIIKPHADIDWSALAAEFMANQAQKKTG